MKIEDLRITDMVEHITTGMKAIIINKTPGKVWYQEIQSMSVSVIDNENVKNWRKVKNV